MLYNIQYLHSTSFQDKLDQKQFGVETFIFSCYNIQRKHDYPIFGEDKVAR